MTCYPTFFYSAVGGKIFGCVFVFYLVLIIMSSGNFQRQIERLEDIVRVRGGQRHKVFLVSDSKRRYLEGQRGMGLSKYIYRPKTKTDASSLIDELHRKIATIDSLLFFIWLGTCDFTRLQRPQKFVSLTDTTVDFVVNNLGKIKSDINSVNPSAEVRMSNLFHFWME